MPNSKGHSKADTDLQFPQVRPITVNEIMLMIKSPQTKMEYRNYLLGTLLKAKKFMKRYGESLVDVQFEEDDTLIFPFGEAGYNSHRCSKITLNDLKNNRA